MLRKGFIKQSVIMVRILSLLYQMNADSIISFTHADSIPKLYHHFSTVTQSTIITGLLGEVLDDLFEKVKRFSTVTVLRIGLQVVNFYFNFKTSDQIHKTINYIFYFSWIY